VQCKDILIEGLEAQNRCFDGDTVAVRVFEDTARWKDDSKGKGAAEGAAEAMAELAAAQADSFLAALEPEVDLEPPTQAPAPEPEPEPEAGAGAAPATPAARVVQRVVNYNDYVAERQAAERAAAPPRDPAAAGPFRAVQRTLAQ
jgi:hypothetical protein